VERALPNISSAFAPTSPPSGFRCTGCLSELEPRHAVRCAYAQFYRARWRHLRQHEDRRLVAPRVRPLGHAALQRMVTRFVCSQLAMYALTLDAASNRPHSPAINVDACRRSPYTNSQALTYSMLGSASLRVATFWWNRVRELRNFLAPRFALSPRRRPAIASFATLTCSFLPTSGSMRVSCQFELFVWVLALKPR